MTPPLGAAAAAAAAALLLLLHFHAASAANMNGGPGQYKIANGDDRSGVSYSTDYDAEYFEVRSHPIRTRYSEVYWRMQDPIPLPDDIVERFEGRVMAVVGYEVDQVRTDEDGRDSPVPITWAYNHHYVSWLLNARKVRLVEAEAQDGDGTSRLGLNHGARERWTHQLLDGADSDDTSDVPLTTFFSEGNGGEYRLSYHGYPKGYAQLIDSPDTFRLGPMMIDTWNRDMADEKYMAGPLPKSSRIPPSAGYSGLLECPCSDRLEKKWDMTYKLQSSGPCDGADAVSNASECFSGARQVILANEYNNRAVSDPSKPSSCTVKQHSDGGADILWNSATAAKSPLVERLVSGRDSPLEKVAFAAAQVNVTVSLAGADGPDAATITIVGPADRWFGVGFGSDSMCLHMQSEECPDGGPYAIVVDGDGQKGVTERKLDYHGPGTVLTGSATVKSNSVDNGNRTVVLTRPLKGASDLHFSFDPSAPSVPVIMARGCGPTFAQHCGHGPAQLNFLAVDVPTPVCRAGVEGTIGGNKFNNKRCAKFPTGDLDAQGNPTCRVETYRGGLVCCRDGMSLLDKDQEIPWPDQYLEYRLKFRFYFEEYQPAQKGAATPSHHSLIRLWWQTETFAGEYDIIQCPKGTPPDQCVQVITSRWKITDMLRDCPTRPDASGCTGAGSTDPARTEGVELIYAGPHCHAPTCLSMDLYDASTGRLLCHVEPIHGKGGGGTYDERGFLAIPPCLWGDPAEGLAEPRLLPLDTELLSVKRNNSTLGHTGDMAMWQMRGVVVPKDKRQGVSTELPRPDDHIEESPLAPVRQGHLRNTGG